MNFFKNLKNWIKNDDKNDKVTGTAIYVTDDIEKARRVRAENPDICVEYHRRRSGNSRPSPIHIYVTEGRVITKQNPEYIEYLKGKHPDLTESEIYDLMREASEKRFQEWKKEMLAERVIAQEEAEFEESTTIEGSKPKQKLKK